MNRNILSDKAGGLIFISINIYILLINLFSVTNPFYFAPAFLKWILFAFLVYVGLSLVFRQMRIYKSSERLSKELEQVHRKMVVVMEGISIENADETSDHIKNVSELSYKLALRYGLSEEEAELIRIAAPLHDVGKVSIPDNILNKPARLTEEEFRVIQLHSQAGYDALKNTNHRILDVASIIALQHHERYNGTGYPIGLKGNEIHIYAQITAITDVFDALMSQRVYKMAYSLNETLRIINREKGEHFAPDLVDMFVEMIISSEVSHKLARKYMRNEVRNHFVEKELTNVG